MVRAGACRHHSTVRVLRDLERHLQFAAQAQQPLTGVAMIDEFAHIELVSHTINMLLTGSTTRGTDSSKIWRGPHPEDGSELRVVDGLPEGGPVPEHDEEPQLVSPVGPDGIDPGLLADVAKRVLG